MKKKKKNVGITEALIFPGESRIGYRRLPMSMCNFKIKGGVMPVMLIGWVQNEIHVCYHFQSLS